MKLKNWIRRSFRNRVFATILMVTLVPLLLCDVVMMQVIVARAEHTQARQARAALRYRNWYSRRESGSVRRRTLRVMVLVASASSVSPH